jgi:NADH:ubiquinone oxidoreductase subunit 6 (subunit J)
MRLVVLTIALLFIAALGVLTGIDIARYGVTVLSVLAILVLVLFMIGIVGALREPPHE